MGGWVGWLVVLCKKGFVKRTTCTVLTDAKELTLNNGFTCIYSRWIARSASNARPPRAPFSFSPFFACNLVHRGHSLQSYVCIARVFMPSLLIGQQ